MNKQQKKIVVVGLTAIVLCSLFPPWINILDVPYHAHSRTPAGYQFILSPPIAKGGVWGIEIDFKTLLVEWVCIAAITGIVFLVLNKPQKPFIPPPNQSN